MSVDPGAWDYISLSDFRAPAAGASVAARGRAVRLWRRLRRLLATREDPGHAQKTEWKRPPGPLIEALAPEPNWQSSAESLAVALEGRWERSPPGSVVAVVGPPGTGVCRVLSQVAAARGWALLEPPSRAALLETPERLETVAGDLESGRDPVVLCPLERFFLRHESVLEPLRRLLSAVAARGAPVILGADSWAWAFLCRATGVGELTAQPLVPRPLTARDLETWVGAPFRSRGIALRPLGAGGSRGPAAGGGAAAPGELTPLLERLAGAARGNWGVARAIWLRALRTPGDGSPAPAGDQIETPEVWIEPDLEAGLPRLPERPVPEDTMVLHALLVHAGLNRGHLSELLPLRSGAVAGSVQRLLRSGVLEEAEELAVSLAAYPGVRQHLAAEGYLVDGF